MKSPNSNSLKKKLEQDFESNGRVTVSDAKKAYECTFAQMTKIFKGRAKLGLEDGEQFFVSIRKDHRRRIIESHLAKYRESASLETLNKLVGLPEKSTFLYKIIRKNDTRIRSDSGKFSLLHHPLDPEQIASVSKAAKDLLFPPANMKTELLTACSLQVKKKLTRLWERSTIIVTIDGGATNTKVASALVREPVPSHQVSVVTYVTNYPRIEEEILLHRGKHLHDPILIGGRQRLESGTYVGRYAEACFQALNVRPDVAFVATTTVSETGEFCSRDFEESRFKAGMLGNPDVTLRCITAVSSKIIASESAGWAFASLDDIDVVITDPGITEKAKAFLDRAKDKGVRILIGPDRSKSSRMT